jgi:succinate dehydrogenase / fumarate reductase membrane anchor subunit
MRTALGKVRGLGSAKQGTGEFVVQRLTSVALTILLTVFVIVVIALNGESYETVRAAIATPLVALVLLAGILLATVHMRIGMQIIVEDYVHAELPKFALLIANWIFAWGVGLTASFAVLKIAFGG